MAPETPRPTPEEWQASVPTLKRSGSQLQGALPVVRRSRPLSRQPGGAAPIRLPAM